MIPQCYKLIVRHGGGNMFTSSGDGHLNRIDSTLSEGSYHCRQATPSGVPCTQALSSLWRPRVPVLVWGPLPRVICCLLVRTFA